MVAPLVVGGIIAGAGALAGGAASAYGQISAGKASSGALKKATKDQIKAAEKAAEKARKDLEPYRESGYKSLYDLTGMERVSNISDSMRAKYDADMAKYEKDRDAYKSAMDAWNKKYQKVRGDEWVWKGKYKHDKGQYKQLRPTRVIKPKDLPKEEWTYQKTGKGFDITGGAKKYMDAIEAIDTGASDKYMKAIEALDFKVSANDPNYLWRQKEGTKAIDAAAASRGLHNSSYTLDRIADFNKNLSASELDRQYKQNYLRKYGQLTDLYNMANQGTQREVSKNTDLYNMAIQSGGKQYGSLIDVATMGMGAASTSGSASQTAGNQIASAYRTEGVGLASNQLYRGEVLGSFASGAGGMPLNAMTAYGYANQGNAVPQYYQGFQAGPSGTPGTTRINNNTRWSPR